MSKPLVVITGASSGIGEAAAKAFSKEGYPLLLLARRVEKLTEFGLPHALCEKVDVTDVETFRAAIKKAEKKYGPVGCLVNNAGVMLLGLAHEQDPKEWQQMLNVNVMGVLNGIHVVLDDMIARKDGTIVNVSSIAGKKTFPSHAAYVGTKFAVHGITENVREEASHHNVRLITIAPGVVETELLSHTSSADIKQNYEGWKEEIGGALIAEDIATSILFAYQQPQRVCIRELVIGPTRQSA